MEKLNSIVDFLNYWIVYLQDIMSGKVLVVLLVGTGIWYTVKLGFVQFREFGNSFKSVFGNIKLSGEKAGKDGMSSFQSLATAIAAQVGTGNLAGAATAMVLGGPGAIFWMWGSVRFLVWLRSSPRLPWLRSIRLQGKTGKLPADRFIISEPRSKEPLEKCWQLPLLF